MKTAIELSSNEIWDLLKSDKKRKWYRDDNKNVFRSQSLEVLHVYPTHIEFWEDLRCSVTVKSPRPTNREELFNSLK